MGTTTQGVAQVHLRQLRLVTDKTSCSFPNHYWRDGNQKTQSSKKNNT